MTPFLHMVGVHLVHKGRRRKPTTTTTINAINRRNKNDTHRTEVMLLRTIGFRVVNPKVLGTSKLDKNVIWGYLYRCLSQTSLLLWWQGVPTFEVSWRARGNAFQTQEQYPRCIQEINIRNCIGFPKILRCLEVATTPIISLHHVSCLLSSDPDARVSRVLQSTNLTDSACQKCGNSSSKPQGTY